MKLKPSPTLIGSFILAALAVGAAALVIFGGHNPLAARRRLVVFFDESVTGLDRGAAVKVRGVHGGRVLSLVPTMSPGSNEAVVAVVCDMNAKALTGADGTPVDLSDADTLRALVGQGLRARLKPAGLSGEYTVDLDFYDPRRYPAREAPSWARSTQPYPAVPALRSVTGELLDDLESAMRNLREADLGAVSRELSGGDIKKTVRQIGDAAASVKALADYLERNPSAIISGKKAPAKP